VERVCHSSLARRVSEKGGIVNAHHPPTPFECRQYALPLTVQTLVAGTLFTSMSAVPAFAIPTSERIVSGTGLATTGRAEEKFSEWRDGWLDLHGAKEKSPHFREGSS
jgi:hypothetical protein